MRTLERILSLLLGIALLVGAVLVTIESVAAAAGSRDPVLVDYRSSVRWLQQHEWSSAPVVGIGILMLLGALLLVVIVLAAAVLAPRRAGLFTLASNDSDLDAGVTAAGVRRTVEAAVRRVPGVTSVRTRVSPSGVRVVATAIVRDQPGLSAAVTATAAEALVGLDLASSPALRVDVSHVES